ncbi:hypothetical protein IKQ02_03170 [bacterium]|nr:hypothetical protein [bacterium]
MEELRIANISTEKLTNEIKKHVSVVQLNNLSSELIDKYNSLEEIKQNVSDISIEDFKNTLEEVNELSNEINKIFKKELSL